MHSASADAISPRPGEINREMAEWKECDSVKLFTTLYIPNGVTNGCLVITFIMFIVYANDDKVKGEKRKPGRQS